jgi:hypothetical protein
MLATSALIICHVCHAAQSGSWEEDLRRCMIYKPISGGRVVIANDEGNLEIDVQRDGNANEEDDKQLYIVTFDDRKPIDTTRPQNVDGGIYNHRLGTHAAISPIFAKARKITIVITAPVKPAVPETITVPIGDGARAMSFLKRCDDYWRRNRKKQR